MRFAWVDQHKDRWRIARLCRVLEVSRNGYYDWRARRNNPGPQATRRAELLSHVHAAFERGRGVYGAPRVQEELAAGKIKVCVNTVARLMKEANLRAKAIRRRFRVITTDSRHFHQTPENLLHRDFTATRPNQKWLCDITYIPTCEGTLYLASVLDVFSRRIVGWSMATHLRAELCLDALTMALTSRRPRGQLLHHSDRGLQYACDAYQELLTEHGITCSMSRAGDCYDNAMMESFHATLKTELVYLQPEAMFATLEEARRMIFEYIEVFYNRQRRHSAIEYLSPEAFEARLN
jgi:transposase InsO family protein